MILFFADGEAQKTYKILNELRLAEKPGIVTIDARADNKVQASKTK